MPDPLLFGGNYIFKDEQDEERQKNERRGFLPKLKSTDLGTRRGYTGLSQEEVDQLAALTELRDWEEKALRARAQFRHATSEDEAALLHEQGWGEESKGPKIETMEQWQQDIGFQQRRVQQLKEHVEGKRVDMGEAEYQRYLDYINGLEKSVSKQAEDYAQQVLDAQQTENEQQVLRSKQRPRYGEQDRFEDIQGDEELSGVFGWLKSFTELPGVDWMFDVLSTPVGTAQTAAYALSSEVSMGIDRITMALTDEDSEAYQEALNSYADTENELADLWERGGGWTGLLAEWIPWMDDENTVMDLMASAQQERVGEAYMLAFDNIEYHTNGLLSDLNEIGDYVDIPVGSAMAAVTGIEGLKFFDIPTVASAILRAPSMPKNAAKWLLDFQEWTSGEDWSASERALMEREVTKMVAAGIQEAQIDPFNFVGAGPGMGAVTKAREIKHLSKVTNSAVGTLARARALGLLDGVATRGGKLTDEVEEAAELASLLGTEFQELGPHAQQLKLQLLMAEGRDGVDGAKNFIDIQELTAAMGDTVQGFRPNNLKTKAGGPLSAIPKGKSRIFKVGEMVLDDMDEAIKVASNTVTDDFVGASIRYADVTKAEARLLKRIEAGEVGLPEGGKPGWTLTEKPPTGKQKWAVEIKDGKTYYRKPLGGQKASDMLMTYKNVQRRFKQGRAVIDRLDPVKVRKKKFDGDVTKRIGELLDSLFKREASEEILKMKPTEFSDELWKLRHMVETSPMFAGKSRARMLKQLDAQIKAAERLAHIAPDKPGAFIHHLTMGEKLAVGRSHLFNAVSRMEEVIPMIKRLSLKTKTKWAMEAIEKMGHKLDTKGLPKILRGMLMSQVPTKLWRAKLLGELAATAESAPLAHKVHQFQKATFKRMSRYKFTADDVEREVMVRRANDKQGLIGVKSYDEGMPLDKDGFPIQTQRGTGKEFRGPDAETGLVEIDDAETLKSADPDEIVEVRKVFSTRKLTEAEQQDILETIRELIEHGSKESRQNPQALLRELNSHPAGRDLLKRLGPHYELALDIAAMYDDSAEFLLLFQQRKGLKVAKLMDNTVEGWFGRVWSPEFQGLLLEHPAMREWILNQARDARLRLTGQMKLPKSGHFAAREGGRDQFAAALEKQLRHKFNLPDKLEIFSKDPVDVLRATQVRAERALQKLRLTQAYADALVPVSAAEVRRVVDNIRNAENQRYHKFIKKMDASDPHKVADNAKLRRRLRLMRQVNEEGPTESFTGGPSPADFMREALELDDLGFFEVHPDNWYHAADGGYTSLSGAITEGFIEKFLGNKSFRAKITQLAHGLDVDDFDISVQGGLDALKRQGYDLKAMAEALHAQGYTQEGIIREIGKELGTALRKAVKETDLETIHDLVWNFTNEKNAKRFAEVLGSGSGIWLDPRVAGARRLETEYGRLMNVWVVDGPEGLSWGSRVIDEGDVMSPIGDKAGRTRTTGLQLNASMSQKLPNGEHRGIIFVNRQLPEGDIPFAMHHETGHLLHTMNQMPPHYIMSAFDDIEQLLLHTFKDLKLSELLSSPDKYMTMVERWGQVINKEWPKDWLDTLKLINKSVLKSEGSSGGKMVAKEAEQAILHERMRVFGDNFMNKLPKNSQKLLVMMHDILQIAGGTVTPYRLTPHELLADTVALATRGIYDPRMPKFSKLMLNLRRQAVVEGTSIPEILAKAKEMHDISKGTSIFHRGPADASASFGVSASRRAATQGPEALKDFLKKAVSEKRPGLSPSENRSAREQLFQAFGAKPMNVDNLPPKGKLAYVRKFLADGGIKPEADEMRAWDMLEKMGAKEPETLEQIVKLNMQMIKHEDVALLDEIFEVTKKAGKFQEGMKSLMRAMQKTVLALPSGALKDTIGSMMWYWIHAKNPVRSAMKAVSLLVNPKAFGAAMRSGARIWKHDSVLDPLISSQAIIGRTEVEAGRTADLIGSKGLLGKLEQQGVTGMAAQVAGAPVDLLGKGVGKVAGKLKLAKTKVGRTVQNLWAGWKRRGTATGRALDIPIHFRKAQDEVWRVALYLDRIESGFSPGAAIHEVYRAFGNMTELTRFEEKYMKQWFFFYTWMRKALPRGATVFFEHPIKARMVYFATIGDVGLNEEGEWDPWLQQLGGWHIGKDEMGNPATLNLMPGSWFQPLRDVTQTEILRRYETEGATGVALGSMNAMLKNAMPLWKVPIEAATGIDSFTGLPISDPRGTGQMTADRAPPILSAPWVPDSVKEFFDVYPVLDKETGDILYYHMDPSKRHFLFKPFPGVEAGLNQAGALTLADERKSSVQQWARVIGTPVYSVPQGREAQLESRKARKMLVRLRQEVSRLNGHPLAFSGNRMVVDMTTPVGRELNERMDVAGDMYLEQHLGKHREMVARTKTTMIQSSIRKKGRPLTWQEEIKIEKAAENMVMPSPMDQERIKEEGRMVYLRQVNPVYELYIRLAERLAYWAQDPDVRAERDPRVLDERKTTGGRGPDMNRLEGMAKRAENVDWDLLDPRE